VCIMGVLWVYCVLCVYYVCITCAHMGMRQSSPDQPDAQVQVLGRVQLPWWWHVWEQMEQRKTIT
jgi:hypothetical protein